MIEWEGNIPAKHSKMKLLASGQSVKWAVEGNKVKVYLPKQIAGGAESLALQFEIVR